MVLAVIQTQRAMEEAPEGDHDANVEAGADGSEQVCGVKGKSGRLLD